MTTLSTSFGALPIALGLGAGAESRMPFGIAVVSGMMFSTFLTLVMVPVVYVLLAPLTTSGRRERLRAEDAEARRHRNGSPSVCPPSPPRTKPQSPRSPGTCTPPARTSRRQLHSQEAAIMMMSALCLRFPAARVPGVLGVLAACLSLSCSSAKLPPIADASAPSRMPGKVVWRDLLTTNASTSQAFYRDLFGWKFTPVTGSGNYYVFRTAEGRLGGGLAQVQSIGRSQWVHHISVANVDATVDGIASAGGRVHLRPMDLGGRARLALIGDPSGATFGLMRVEGGDPADASPPVRDFLWSELWTDDVDKSIAFYRSVAGYEMGTIEVPGQAAYRTFQSQQRPRSGVQKLPGSDIKPGWLQYVRVDDVDAVVARAEQLGGSTLLRPSPTIREGTVAIISDPSGAPNAVQEWKPGQGGTR
jgi:predicted enzyme related to lactoylglutathione lyase